MEKVIVKWSTNWADEIDFYGFEILEKEKYEKYLGLAKKAIEQGNNSYMVGTNEEIEIHSAKELESCLTVRKISDEEAKVIKKFIGKGTGEGNPLILANHYEEDE